jgi:hypothetical protein
VAERTILTIGVRVALSGGSIRSTPDMLPTSQLGDIRSDRRPAQFVGGTADGDVRRIVFVLVLGVTWLLADTATAMVASIRSAQTDEFGIAPNSTSGQI